MKTEDVREVEAPDLNAAVVALMQLLKRMNVDLVVSMKLLESKSAKDHVTGAGLSIADQKAQLRLRLEKQLEFLSELRKQLKE